MNEHVLAQLTSADQKEAAKASLAFAQQIWNGTVGNEVILKLLRDDDVRVRSAVAWAVADAHRPSSAVDWLLMHGLDDESDVIRFWTIQILIESHESAALPFIQKVQPMLADPSERVRRNARCFIEKWGPEKVRPEKISGTND